MFNPWSPMHFTRIDIFNFYFGTVVHGRNLILFYLLVDILESNYSFIHYKNSFFRSMTSDKCQRHFNDLELT